MRWIVVGAAAMVTGVVAPIGALERPIGLRDAIALAVEQNPALAAAAEQRRELAGGVAEAWADAYPQLDLTAGWSRTRNPSLLNSPDFEEFLDQFPGFEPRSQDLWTAAIELRQAIWAGGKVRATVDLAELALEIVESRIATARLDVARAAATAWAEVIAAEREIAVLGAERAARESALSIVESRLEIGEATALERLRELAALRELEPALAEAEGRRAAAMARLRSAIGEAAGTAVEVEPTVPELPIAADLESSLAAALAARPELSGLDLELATLAGQAELTRAEGRPRVDLEAAWGRQARLGENLRDGLYDDWRIGLFATWSLSDGGARAGQLVQLESRQRQLELRLEDLRRAVELEVETAWFAHRTALARRIGAASALEAAREAARVARESWQLGVALQLEVLEAEDLARRAELAAIDAELAAWGAAFDLARAVGRSPATLLDEE